LRGIRPRSGVFFKKLAAVHPRFGTPALAVATSCAWAMVLAASGTFEQLLTYVVFVGWIFYALAAVAIVGNQIVSAPGQAALGLGIVLLGAPAYALWRRA